MRQTLLEMGAVKADEAAKSYDCKIPGCRGEARSATGRHAYCLACRVNRGTALPDGTPIEATSKALSRRRKTKQLAGSFEGCALELVEVARSLDLAIARFKVARPALEQAVAAWNEALAQLPKTVEQPSTNGAGPEP